MMKEETVVKSIRISATMAKTIEIMAKGQNRNFSNMVDTLLKEILTRYLTEDKP